MVPGGWILLTGDRLTATSRFTFLFFSEMSWQYIGWIVMKFDIHAPLRMKVTWLITGQCLNPGQNLPLVKQEYIFWYTLWTVTVLMSLRDQSFEGHLCDVLRQQKLSALKYKPVTEPMGHKQGILSEDGVQLSVLFANTRMVMYCMVSPVSEHLSSASHILRCSALSFTSALQSSKTSNITSDKSSPCSCSQPCLQQHLKLEQQALSQWLFALWASLDAAL